jgi:AAA family ATP:ADP antiporter
LFLRTSRQAKYKAKFAIDSFFARAGDAMSAALVFAGTLFAMDIRSFALFNAASVVVWLVVAGAIVRARRREKMAALQPRVAA